MRTRIIKKSIKTPISTINRSIQNIQVTFRLNLLSFLYKKRTRCRAYTPILIKIRTNRPVSREFRVGWAGRRFNRVLCWHHSKQLLSIAPIAKWALDRTKIERAKVAAPSRWMHSSFQAHRLTRNISKDLMYFKKTRSKSTCHGFQIAKVWLRSWNNLTGFFPRA